MVSALFTQPTSSCTNNIKWRLMIVFPLETLYLYIKVGLIKTCPRCNQIETSLHVLRLTWWAIHFCYHLPGFLPFKFLPRATSELVQNKLNSNHSDQTHKVLWKLHFVMSIWQLWLARNERLSKDSSSTQSQLIHASNSWILLYSI